MADKIIQTQKREERRPGLSCALSLFFTGLGQMYNGDLAMGGALFLMRTAVLLAIPAAAVMRGAGAGIIPFMGLVAAALAITIASPIEALIRAKHGRELPLRAYNSAYAYAGYALTQTLVNIVLALIIASFFSLGQVKGKGAEPLLEEGDMVLVYRYAPHGYRRGDLVFTGKGSAARVIALGGDTVRYDNNIFYVNGGQLPLGYLADDAIARFSESRGDVLSETNEGRKYPVRFKQSPEITLRGIGPLVAKGNLVVSADSRLAKDFARAVRADDIEGKVEGILFSSYIRKIGMDTFGNLR